MFTSIIILTSARRYILNVIKLRGALLKWKVQKKHGWYVKESNILIRLYTISTDRYTYYASAL